MKPGYGRSVIRHERWPKLAKEAVKRNVGTSDTDAYGEATSGSNHDSSEEAMHARAILRLMSRAPQSPLKS
jgi:hypothetical protein